MPAREFLNELGQAIVWIEPTSIVLIEQDFNPRDRANWAVTTTGILVSTRDEFDKVISKWRSLELQLDWDGVESKGDRRMLTAWIFPPEMDEGTVATMTCRPQAN